MSLLVCGGLFLEEIKGREARIGGSGFTAAIAAARYGAEVTLAGWIGSADACEAFAILDAAGVDRRGVLVLDGATTRYRISDPIDLAMPEPSVTIGAVPCGRSPALPSAPVVLCFGTPGFDAIRSGWLDRAAEGAVLLFDRQGSHSMVGGAEMAATVPAAQRILLGNAHEVIADNTVVDLTSALEALPPTSFELALVKTGAWGVIGVGPEAGDERGFGAFDVPVRSTIGSGDVFAGVVSALVAQGTSVLDAVPEAVAAAGAWIASDAEVPPTGLHHRAAELVANGAATWVDRRILERQRFMARFDDDVPLHTREQITRALEHLGMAMVPHDGKSVVTLNLRGLHCGHVTEAVMRAIQWARDTFGKQT